MIKAKKVKEYTYEKCESIFNKNKKIQYITKYWHFRGIIASGVKMFAKKMEEFV